MARPLAEQLQALLAAFFAAAPPGTEETIQLQTEVSCPIPATDGSQFACRVAEVIREWLKDNQPITEAALTFDLAAFSTLNSTTLPLVRLSGLVLRRANVTDLSNVS